MTQILHSQARLQHSLLRLGARLATRFQIPMRTLSELMRMAYYAELRERGLPHNQIARHMDQTDRNIRYYALRHRENFFAGEVEPGLLRSVEELVAERSPTGAELRALLPEANERLLGVVLKDLLGEGRILLREDQRYVAGPMSAGLRHEGFEERLEALEPTLQALSEAVTSRLVYDESVGARIKSITFRGQEGATLGFLTRFEAELRQGLMELEKQADTSGRGQEYALNLTIGPTLEAKPVRGA